MCQFASFVLTQDKAFWSGKSDSHTAIIEEHVLHEDGAHGPNLLKVELVPVTSLTDIRTWKYHVDQDIMPEWIRDDEEERTRKAAAERFAGVDPAKLSAGGNLYLGGLTSLPPDAKLTAGGDLYLGGLTKRKHAGIAAAHVVWKS